MGDNFIHRICLFVKKYSEYDYLNLHNLNLLTKNIIKYSDPEYIDVLFFK